MHANRVGASSGKVMAIIATKRDERVGVAPVEVTAEHSNRTSGELPQWTKKRVSKPSESQIPTKSTTETIEYGPHIPTLIEIAEAGELD